MYNMDVVSAFRGSVGRSLDMYMGGVVLLLPESARLLISSSLRSVDDKSGG